MEPVKETLLEKVIMKHIDTYTPEADRKFEKKAISGHLDMHKQGHVSAYEVLQCYNMHHGLKGIYYPGQN